MSALLPRIGSRISLISRADIRYEGLLFTVDAVACTIALSNVRSFGTEDRETSCPVGPQPGTYDYILFRGSDIKHIKILPSSTSAASSSPNAPSDEAVPDNTHSDDVKPKAGSSIKSTLQTSTSLSEVTSTPQKSSALKESTNVQTRNAHSNPAAELNNHDLLTPEKPSTSFASPTKKNVSHQSSLLSASTPKQQPDPTDGNFKQLLTPTLKESKKVTDDKNKLESDVVVSGRKKEAKFVSQTRSVNTGSKEHKQSKFAASNVAGKYKDDKSRYSYLQTTSKRFPSNENYEMNGGQLQMPHFKSGAGTGSDAMYGRYREPVNFDYDDYNTYRGFDSSASNPWYHQGNGFRGAAGHFRGNNSRGGYWGSRNVPSRINNRFDQSATAFMTSRHYEQPTMIYRSSVRPETRHGGGKKEEDDLSAEYDFEKANIKFEELKSQFTKMKINDVESDNGGGVKNGSHDEAGVSSSNVDEGPSESGKAFYDKTKSFFDNISCETHEKSKTRRNNWFSERKLNSETFGMNAARSAGTAYRGGRGHYVHNNRDDGRNKNYRYGYGRY